jgi:hypothetical protein
MAWTRSARGRARIAALESSAKAAGATSSSTAAAAQARALHDAIRGSLFIASVPCPYSMAARAATAAAVVGSGRGADP